MLHHQQKIQDSLRSSTHTRNDCESFMDWSGQPEFIYEVFGDCGYSTYSTAGMVVYIHLIPIVIVLVFVYR